MEINSALNISFDVLHDACMHDMENMKWHVMLKMLDQSWFIIETCTKLLKIRKKETHLNLNLIFHNKTSLFFFIIFNIVFFLSTPFYSIYVSFLLSIFKSRKNIFLEKTNKTLVFFHFLFKVKHYPTSRKKQSGKQFFVYFFFWKFKTHIFCFDKVKFFEF